MQQRRVFERYLRVEEERQLLRTVAQFGDPLAKRDHAWMRLLRHTGIRVCTLAGLDVSDARLAIKKKRLTVRAAINKGEQGYRVPMNKKALQAMRDLLRLRRELGHPEKHDMPLVMSRNWDAHVVRGRRPCLSIRSFQARMSMWVGRAGLDINASPHWWRHTLGKRIMKQSTAQDPRAIAQQALGHSNINNTMIYTMPDREDIELAMEEAS